MNYKRIILVLIIFSIGFLAFVILSTPDKPPMPKVTYRNEPVKVLQGSYGWETFTKSVQADSPVPPELVENTTPTTVAPQSNLKVTFNYKPNNVDVMLWTEAGSLKYNIDHNTVIMPEEEGIYVFEIRGEWDQGHSIYAFKIRVK